MTPQKSVALDKLHLRKQIQIFTVTGKQIIEHHNLVSVFEQQPHKIGADKSRSAGN